VVSVTTWPLFPLERTPVSIEYEAGWAPEPVWTFWRREKYLDITGTRIPDRFGRYTD